MIKLTRNELKNVFGGVAMASCTATCGNCASISCSGGSYCEADNGSACFAFKPNPNGGDDIPVDAAFCCDGA